MKSVKVALLAGLMGLAGVVEADGVIRAREFSSYLTNSSTSPDVVFEGITLKELTDGTYLLGGCLSGDWEPEKPASFSTRVLPELAENATEMEVQFQYKSYNNGSAIVKWVDVVFTQDGSQIKAYQKNQGWVNDRGNFGTKISTGGIAWTSGSQTTYRITRLGAGVQNYDVSGAVTWTALPVGIIEEDIIHLHEDDILTVSGFKFQNPVIGAGKIVVDRVPGGALKNSTSWYEWTGTLTLKDIDLKLFDPGDYGHMGSKVEVVNCSGYFPKTGEGNTELVITEKMTVNDGYTGQSYTVAKLSGDGTLDVTSSVATVTFTDSADFTGRVTGTGAGHINLDKKAILVVNEGEAVSIGSSVEKVLTVYGNGGTITSSANIWADKNAITSLILQHDSTIGGEFALGLSATSQGATTADLAGYTLTINKTGNFNLCNATISNGGTIDVVKGNILTWGTASTMSAGTLKLGSAATVELNANLTVEDLVNGGAKISGASVLTVNGTLSGGGTIPKLTMGDDATIKLNRNEQLTVSSKFTCGTPLILDLTDYYGEGGGKPVGETAHTVITLPAGTDASTYLSKIQVAYPTLHAAGVLSAEENKIFFTFGHLDLYWADYSGTFWEAVFGGDVHGNKGLGRTEAGATQAILAGDTVIFDKRHYQVAGEFAEQSPYWHYDENLYIKDEVNPGTKNDWDLKVLEGVTLKMGLRGARATGQNIIRDFKIYVEDGSTLELGYWGNTHHYQGVIRPNVTFGGAGVITLGDDMGASCRIEGNLKVKQDPSAQETEVPTLDVRGKELVVQGGQIDVNLTGFGALSGSGTITTPITFENATINATDANGFTFKNKTTFTGTLTVDMTSAPTGEMLIKICTKGEGGSFVFADDIDVIVRVNGNVEPAFYTLALNDDGNLCVKVAPTQITYSAAVRLGYDYKTMIVDVDMNPAIDGVVAEVTVADVEGKLQHWSAPVVGMRNQGRAEVMVGDADDNFEPGEYTMTVSVGDWHKDLNYTLSVAHDGDLATVNGIGYASMREAVSAGGTIELLTNIFFAAPEGTYSIARNGFDIMPVNYTTIDVLTNEVTAEDEVVFKRGGEGITRVVIAGDWIAAGLPWRTKKTIDAAVWMKTEAMAMAPFEAYVLGFDARDALTAKIIARGVETGDKDTIEVSDGLRTKLAAETGVVVTKTLVDAETKREVSATPIYNLLEMETKAKLLKLNYEFSADLGQEPDQGE